MEFIPEEIHAYSQAHSTPENALLKRIHRDTHAQVLMPRMLSGHLQGRVLAEFSHMLRPSSILEIGTYTGYSALCMAEGLVPNGKLITIDINEELETRVRGYFNDSSYAHQIDYLIGDAQEILPSLSGPFDLVFIDADKINYQTYYNLVFDKVRKGGYIIADNVLWSGKVVETNKKIDKDTQALLDFNTFVAQDSRAEKVLMPLRDGLFLIRKLV